MIVIGLTLGLAPFVPEPHVREKRKLLNRGVDQTASDQDIEWAARPALECRRSVKEQQKRIGASELRSTRFTDALTP